MKTIKDIIGTGEYKADPSVRKFKSTCTPEQFKDTFLTAAKAKMFGAPFMVDSDNKDVINQLYYYLVGHPEFKGDPRKGVLLLGTIGCGKTVIMESFIEVFNETAGKIITNIHSKDISRIITDNDVGYLNKRPLFVDDIGKEQEAIKHYGTVIKPLEDVISERYKKFALTFGTSNYKLEDLPYSTHTVDRMKQMFNIMVLTGKSRRV